MDSQVLERGLDCFLAIAHSDHPLTVEEIAKVANLPVSSVYRLLRPFEQRNLIQRTDKGTRILGLGVMAFLGSIHNIYGSEITEIALPIMRELAQQTQETILLSTLMDTDVICLEAVESPQPIRLSPKKGVIQTPSSGCSSKILLAYCEPEIQEKVMDKWEGYQRLNGQVVTKDLLQKEYEQIRRDGYTITIEEIDTGAAGVAAPVFGKGGRILAGITVTGPEYRFRDQQLKDNINLVITAAQRITERCSLFATLH